MVTQGPAIIRSLPLRISIHSTLKRRVRVSRIAIDYDSPWQSIAPYLVARTFVGQVGLLGRS